MIKVSVLIPLYNQEELVIKCINSIPKRDDIEVIVVDDCSTDNSYNVVKNAFPFVKIYKNRTNLGIGQTRNILLDKANGEYIYFLDSDDFIYPDNFLEAVDKLDNQICLKPKCDRNDGVTWYSRVHRGDFLKKDFIGDTKHPDWRCNEDTKFKRLLNKKEGYKEEKIDIVVYHYNAPRKGSLTWKEQEKKKSLWYVMTSFD